MFCFFQRFLSTIFYSIFFFSGYFLKWNWNFSVSLIKIRISIILSHLWKILLFSKAILSQRCFFKEFKNQNLIIINKTGIYILLMLIILANHCFIEYFISFIIVFMWNGSKKIYYYKLLKKLKRIWRKKQNHFN